ncbi:MAG: hypothetical protein GY953_58490 [bacterium]|nr:hypothetical protein [bacterium]
MAWLAHGDLETAAEALAEALAVLSRAANRTVESAREDWIRVQVKRTLQESILEAYGPDSGPAEEAKDDG